MKKFLIPSIRLTIVMIVLICIVYIGLVNLIGKTSPGNGDGLTISSNGKVVGYDLLGQKFSQDNYFWSRPSAVEYNAAGSAGSNKGPSNADYLKIVQDRIDTFLVHNPGVRKEEIPADLVTASGSGLDPDISPAAAYVQVARIARVRGLSEQSVKTLVDNQIENSLLGPSKVNVLKLNLRLDRIKS